MNAEQKLRKIIREQILKELENLKEDRSIKFPKSQQKNKMYESSIVKEGKLPIDKLKSMIEKKWGKNPSCSGLAYFVYDNYDKVTGLKKSSRDDEGYFPEEIETLVNEFGFDIDEFSDCYSQIS